jgi:diaminopimelate epimerase
MERRIAFFKLSGSGNDFIIIDNRDGLIAEKGLTRFIQNVCLRKMSVGADGMILVERSERADFKWRFYNSDGSRAEMCGNGARCVARFAFVNQIAGEKLSFETDTGIVTATVMGDQVKVSMPDPEDLKIDFPLNLDTGEMTVSRVNTGVPHVIVHVDDVETVDVVAQGREIRYHPDFSPAGTNVNFICRRDHATIAIRTYERGVEDETLACGTGSIASALVTASEDKTASPLRVITRSGIELKIHYRLDNGRFSNIFLEGDARIIYKGELWDDALRATVN